MRKIQAESPNFKIDVIIVTKCSEVDYSNISSNVPLNNLIVERSIPLGLARLRAIQRVKTKWFAFIDDDVILTNLWFDAIRSQIKEDVGAIEGITYIKGLGEKWDKDISVLMKSDEPRGLGLGSRGYTHDTLIRTELVKDWRPSREDLSAWEDYEITQHILRKGYKWIKVPVEAYHIISWRKLWNNAIWSMENWKKITSKKDWIRLAFWYALMVIRFLLDWFLISMPLRARIYSFYTTLGSLWGILKR